MYSETINAKRADKSTFTGCQIHETAMICEGAKIGSDTIVGPYSLIGPNVCLGKGNIIGPHAVIDGRTTLGDENKVFQFASVGAVPQDLKYRNEPSTLRIGNRNLIREYVTLQPGTNGGGMTTTIGDSNLFMACSHVGHDCLVGSGNVFANSVALAGHVTIANGVTLGGMTGIHQFVRIGDLALLGAGSMVSKDIPPYCLAQGDRAGLVGINKIGLERKQYSAQDISKLIRLYREVLFSTAAGTTLVERVGAALTGIGSFELGSNFLQFFIDSTRGVTLPRRKSADSDGTNDE